MGSSALIYAVKRKSFQDVHTMLETGADVRERDEKNATALHYVVSQPYNDLNIIKLLLAAKPDIHAISDIGTPLDIAVRYQMGLHAVQALIGAGANPNFISKPGQYERQTPLHYAAIYGTAEIIKFLVKKGANTNALDGAGNTPLHWAVSRYDVVEALLSSGANPNLTGLSGMTVLHTLVTMGDEAENVATADLLIRYGTHVNVSEALLKQTPLHYAAKDGCYRLCQCLIKNGANLLMQDAYNKCPGQVVPVQDRHLFESFAAEEIQEVIVEEKISMSVPAFALKALFKRHV